MTDVLPLLSVLPCNPGFINVAPASCPYSSGPDGDKKELWFKNYHPPFLPWPPPTKGREGINLRLKVFGSWLAQKSLGENQE